MAYRLIGQNFIPEDVRAKVTGRARYAEDFRAEGMLYAKLLSSPLPHARIRRIDLSAALKLPGVVGVLTGDEVPPVTPPLNPVLAKGEVCYVGEPILALAAVTEAIAADAVERIRVDYEPLPHLIDPLETLLPGGPDARTDGNVGGPQVKVQTLKWDAAAFAAAGDAALPLGKPIEQWSYGDLDAGFKAAAAVVEESFVTAAIPHHCLESRSAMAYWQGTRCYLYGSMQSHTGAVPQMADYIGIATKDLVFIGEYCGGGFGSKGSAYPAIAIAPLLARKLQRPVMLRITRLEEYAIGGARPTFQGYARLGFAANGRMTAADLYIVQENGGRLGNSGNDFRSAATYVCVTYQPPAMRWRGIPVFTNTPPTCDQRGPGVSQTAPAIEALIDKAARRLAIDRLEIRKINAPDGNGKEGPKRNPISSAHLKEALDTGAARFGWQEKIRRSGQRVGNKLIGIGVGQGYHPGGNDGFDGLLRITPDGKLHVHTGIGNLGTYSYAATSRVAAEFLGYDWDGMIIERGDSRRALPWNSRQGGTQTASTHARTNYAAAMDARRKLQEIAASMLGGAAEDYDLADRRVINKADPSKAISFADAARKAIELGGKYSGMAPPADINPITRDALALIAGTGLIGVARDTLPKPSLVTSFAATFVAIELDAETGKIDITDMITIVDCGTVLHPEGLAQQIKGAAVHAIGMAHLERRIYDPGLGIPAAPLLYQSKPPTWLDVPADIGWGAVGLPDPENPVGVKGVGEPPKGSAAAAVVNAISDALGGVCFNRTPVSTDMILNALAGRPQAHRPLQVNTV
jgi:CO/xanthine dehydrogenase Mo-binding subunit